jgi:signal transduction histidine kinase
MIVCPRGATDQEIQGALPGNTSDSDLDFLIQEVPRAIDQSLEGVLRVSKIVRAMRDFSHPAGENKVATDINREVETTIAVATNEWRHVATLETELDPKLPSIPCFPGELHQVLLNVIVNAAQAISVVAGEKNQKGAIRVQTAAVNGCVEIRISDTGTGIREDHQQNIRPVFTKRTSAGTGRTGHRPPHVRALTEALVPGRARRNNFVIQPPGRDRNYSSRAEANLVGTMRSCP